jgi:hypothetical protein
MVRISEIAERLGLQKDLVLKILWEKPSLRVSKKLQDRVFETAKSMGYDMKKLKIGKRILLRKEALQNMLNQIRRHPHWQRREILQYLEEAIKFLERVQRRVFKEERIVN